MATKFRDQTVNLFSGSNREDQEVRSFDFPQSSSLQPLEIQFKGAHIASFQAALAAGAHLACGTDAGTPLNPHGRIAREIALFVRYGATPAQAIRAATGSAARAIGRDDVGLLEVGRKADLLWIADNPLEDITRVEKVRGVWMDGRQVEGPPPQAVGV